MSSTRCLGLYSFSGSISPQELSSGFECLLPFHSLPSTLIAPLPNGCQCRFADVVLRKRCELLHAGDIQRLILDSHEAPSDRVMASINSASSNTVTFSKTARAAIRVGAGQVGRACKVAFTYGLETDPGIAAKCMKKLTLQARHPHIAPHIYNIKSEKNLISSKALTASFLGMPIQFAAHKDGWTWELLRDAASRPYSDALLRRFAEYFSNRALPKDL